jgi:nitroreductase
MDVMQAIYRRRAVRVFTGEDVTKSQLEDLIAAAVQAPSAYNVQPWAFAATADRGLMRKMGTLLHRHLLCLPPESDEVSPSDLGRAAAFDVFHGAPAVVVVCATDEGDWVRECCGMAAENLMLAACAQKLGTCCIGLAAPWLSLPSVRSLLDIPSHYRPLLPIVIGHPYGEQRSTVARHPARICWMRHESREPAVASAT